MHTMPRITENNIHHWVNDFLKVNVTLLILILILVLIGLQTQQVCDKIPCHTPKTVEDTYTIKGIELNQYFGDKMPVVGGAQLSSLGNAFIRTGEGITKYSQYLRFNGDGTDEVIEIEITNDEHSVDINVPNQGDLRLNSATGNDILIGQTKYGTLFQINRRKTTSSLFVDFPKKELLSSVTIVQNRIEH